MFQAVFPFAADGMASQTAFDFTAQPVAADALAVALATAEAPQPSRYISATYSPEDNKLRLYAARRLSDEDFARVKAAGYRWAPKQELFVAPAWTPAREDLALELAGEIEAEEMTLAERAAAKAERLEALADKRNREAHNLHRYADDLSQAFYMGQPILVGHHSERKARKTQERMHAAMDKACAASRAANYWLYRAEGVEHHANRKNNPTTRANRIKTLLAELRDVQRDINSGHAAVNLWESLTTPELIRAALRRLDYRATFARSADYDAVNNGTMTPEDVRAACIDRARAMIASPNRRRVIDHTLNRLAYERSMLGDVPLYAGEITATTLQAFAREHGAEKPTATQTAPGVWSLSSPVALPLHLVDGCTMEHDADTWRAIMQACGYTVPEKREAGPPLLNLNAASHQTRKMYARNGETEALPVVHVDKATYAKIPNDYKGVRVSACGLYRFRVAMERSLNVGGGRHGLAAVFLTDSKAHEAPQP